MDAHRHPDPQRSSSLSRPPYPHPSKEAVRAWMERRSQARQPPPAPAEIRRQLGWHGAPRAPIVAVAHGWPAAMFPAMVAEWAAVTLLAWRVGLAAASIPSEKSDRAIT